MTQNRKSENKATNKENTREEKVQKASKDICQAD
jgi:hypothetical protein